MKLKPALFEEDGWCVRKSNFNHAPDTSFVTHDCLDKQGVAFMDPTMQRDTAMRCIACGKKAPESVVGLWTLHNWDRNQEV